MKSSPTLTAAGRTPGGAGMPGYDLAAEVYRGRKSVVYRGTRSGDGLPVIIKTLREEYPTPLQTAGLRREYELLHGLAIRGVAQAYALEANRDRLALVLEDIGGDTLKTLIARREISLTEFFDLARQLASLVGEIHRHNIIHKDINPNNIIVNRERGELRLIDFGIASRVSSEQPRHLQHAHLLEGTIAYMSPEQTGRMNRDLDYRSDLYSLGITLYEALTGHVPFESADALEVIHGHVARTPIPPHFLAREVPPALSAVVLKLLAKSAEDRYQSAAGLEADLSRVQAAWESTGSVPGFPLGEHDFRERFVIPQRLYGRETEITRLLEAFDRVAGGTTELVLVSGYSGIGKTSLIQELHGALAQRRGHFIQGKFDQLARDVPYRALADAFQGLIRHILAGADNQVQPWRDRVISALGHNGQVMVDLIPMLGNLTGPQPSMPELDPAEAQNRFNRVFQQLIGAFAGPEYPLVLFLDDLQWADPATLKLLPLFLANPELSGLLVIGTYRDNEVSPNHPLTSFIESLKRQDGALTEIVLPPLGPDHLGALLADAMGATPGISELSPVLFEKTAGNPFFAIQFLMSLHQAGHLAFDRTTRQWRVELEAIRRLRMTENVVDLMTDRLRRLDEPARRALRLAACIGNRFDLATLAVVSELEPSDLVAHLWPVLDQGLILSEEQSYGLPADLADGRRSDQRRFRFLHDRVQQAAYALIPEDLRPQAHLTLGRLLLARGEEASRPEWLFDVVNQLNYGAGLITDSAERLGLAELNLAAGRRAKASAAFPSAFGYFAAGTSLLTDADWADHHELGFALHLERAEAEYLTGRLAEAERSYATLLQRAATPLESADAYLLMMIQHETGARYQDAITAGMAGLRLLGFGLPEQRSEQSTALVPELEEIRRLLGGRPVSSVVELPRLEDQPIRKAVKLLTILWAPAYISGESPLSDLVGARMVSLSLRHGNCEESAYGYVAFGMTIGWRLGDYAEGYEWGRLGIALNERLADLRLRARVHHRFSALVNPWRQPFATCLPYAREAVRAGLESGDFMIAAYGQFQQSWWGMHIEPDLDGFLERHRPTVAFLGRMHAYAYGEVQKMILQWALALQGKTETPASLSGEGFSENQYLQSYGRKGIFGSWYVTMKLELLNTFGQVEEARAAAREWEPVAEVFASSIWPALFAFRHVLALCAWLPGAAESERAAAQAKLDQLAGRLRIWADNAPENFGHLYHLAAAEIARVREQSPDAFGHYEAALQAAELQPSPRYRALANELYGEFWLPRQPGVAAVYLREAHYRYRQWGAHAKVAQLERRHGALLARHVSQDDTDIRPGQTTATQESQLDLHTVIKVAQALAGAIDLEQLLRQLMRVAIEHAGAEGGHFILEHEGAPAVHVTGGLEGVQVAGDAGTPLAEADSLPVMLINLVRRTGETVVLDDATAEGQFTQDPYIVRARPRSIICTAVLNHGRLIGALYLENNLSAGIFTPGRAQVLQIVAAQAAVAIENAKLFAEIRQLKDRLQAENVYLAEEIRTHQGFEEIVGETPVLRQVLSDIEQVAGTDSTVLITGETGTGKELVARAIHNHSRRRDRPMVSVNCGAISSGLVESELFGHERGAFTGALSRKIGRFELADGGTLFLDEIGDLGLDLQVKLLRVLQEGEFERLGGTKTIQVDVRVLAATNEDLEHAVEDGRFRPDLFYRLNVFPIRVPALRDRKEDIPILVRHFVLKYASRAGKQIRHIPRQTLDSLAAYDWPGNIRELANICERSVIVSRGSTLELGGWTPPRSIGSSSPSGSLRELERSQILTALEETKWRVSGPAGAAVRLGLKPTTLEARMKKLGIIRPK
jgi:predicted ATPase/transcriptional regulator with GAF, ATPase, and Fis domain/tRNA A-37 threonylcarbamoyl transferase component Bud32